MSFFNKKEEVLDIELTQFGKHKLSKGLFKPVYYAFFDDDIIYDNKFAGVTTEIQNDIEARIKDAPRLKTQYVFSGIETEITKNIKDIRTNNPLNDRLEVLMQQPTAEKYFNIASPIASSEVGSQKAPAWSIDFLKGEISGSVAVQTNSSQPSVRIPQIDTEITYTTTVVADSVREASTIDDGFNDVPMPNDFADGSYIHLKEDLLLLQIEEINSQNLNSEFEIEVFKVEKQVVNGEITDREILIPLRFQQDISKNYRITDNNIYVPLVERDRPIMLPERDNVEYFLDIDIDSQIDTHLMCEADPVDKTKGLYSKRLYECEDDTPPIENIYESDSPYEDPCED